jgi:hypothetical protein
VHASLRRVSYQWRYQDEAGAEIDGPGEQFDSKSAAESWFADQWLQLRQQGVKRVILLEDGSEAGPPVELEEA